MNGLQDDYLCCVEDEITACLKAGVGRYYQYFWDRQGSLFECESRGLCILNVCIPSDSAAADQNGSDSIDGCSFEDEMISVPIRLEISHEHCQGSRKNALRCRAYVMRLLCNCFKSKHLSAHSLSYVGSQIETKTDPEETDQLMTQITVNLNAVYIVNMCDGTITTRKGFVRDQAVSQPNVLQRVNERVR